MMSKPPAKADDFLRAMSTDLAEPPAPAAPAKAAPERAPSAAPRIPSRSGLKHIGGYFDRETVEKVAVLRARLALDNSELLKLAIEELHRKQSAKRSFGES
jgi:hypothetical protein